VIHRSIYGQVSNRRLTLPSVSIISGEEDRGMNITANFKLSRRELFDFCLMDSFSRWRLLFAYDFLISVGAAIWSTRNGLQADASWMLGVFVFIVMAPIFWLVFLLKSCYVTFIANRKLHSKLMSHTSVNFDEKSILINVSDSESKIGWNDLLRISSNSKFLL